MFFKKKCTTCGSSNPRGAAVCGSCGIPFNSARGEDSKHAAETVLSNVSTTKVEYSRLRLAINQVVFAVSNDVSRPALTGVYAEFDGDWLTLWAADGNRLAVHRTSLSEPVSRNTAVIIPAKDLNELARQIAGDWRKGTIEIAIDRNNAVFHAGEKQISSRLINGAFPDYRLLIDRSLYITHVIFSPADLLKLVLRLAAGSPEDGNIIKLLAVPSKGKLVVPGAGEVDADIEGKENRTALNRLYLNQGLNAFSETKIALDIIDALSPALFHAVGTHNYLYAVMPVFVKW